MCIGPNSSDCTISINESFRSSKIAKNVTTTPILPSLGLNKEVNSKKDSVLILSNIWVILSLVESSSKFIKWAWDCSALLRTSASAIVKSSRGTSIRGALVVNSGSFALAANKLLPAAQLIFTSISQMRFSSEAVKGVLEFVEMPKAITIQSKN